MRSAQARVELEEALDDGARAEAPGLAGAPAHHLLLGGGARGDRAAREGGGMRFSPFVVAVRATRRGGRGRGGRSTAVLSEAEQRALHERVALLDRCNRALVEQLPAWRCRRSARSPFSLTRRGPGSANAGREPE